MFAEDKIIFKDFFKIKGISVSLGVDSGNSGILSNSYSVPVLLFSVLLEKYAMHEVRVKETAYSFYRIDTASLSSEARVLHSCHPPFLLLKVYCSILQIPANSANKIYNHIVH